MRVLITGGAGFVGACLAECYRRAYPEARIVAFDSLRRRGSETNLARLRRHEVDFIHGDVRAREDLARIPGSFDLVIAAAAEPSALAGLDGAPDFVLDTNLFGTVNCLELARQRGGAFILLSTSRVYSIAPLQRLRLEEGRTRLELAADQQEGGVSRHGIAEGFATHLPRSLYGATKLAAEVLAQEYASAFGLRLVIDRCGVLAGAGQFGHQEQGFVAHWVLSHERGEPLEYRGFGGAGKQVRDVMHPEDLFSLIERQLGELQPGEAEVFNVGGGPEGAISLCELSALCREVTGREVPIGSRAETSPVDIPWFVTDARRARERHAWAPQRSVREIVEEISSWARCDGRGLSPDGR